MQRCNSVVLSVCGRFVCDRVLEISAELGVQLQTENNGHEGTGTDDMTSHFVARMSYVCRGVDARSNASANSESGAFSAVDSDGFIWSFRHGRA